MESVCWQGLLDQLDLRAALSIDAVLFVLRRWAALGRLQLSYRRVNRIYEWLFASQAETSEAAFMQARRPLLEPP